MNLALYTDMESRLRHATAHVKTTAKLLFRDINKTIFCLQKSASKQKNAAYLIPKTKHRWQQSNCIFKFLIFLDQLSCTLGWNSPTSTITVFFSTDSFIGKFQSMSKITCFNLAESKPNILQSRKILISV